MNKKDNGAHGRKGEGIDTKEWSGHFALDLTLNYPKKKKIYFCFWEGHLDCSFLYVEDDVQGNRLHLKQERFVSNVEKSLTREDVKRI